MSTLLPWHLSNTIISSSCCSDGEAIKVLFQRRAAEGAGKRLVSSLALRALQKCTCSTYLGFLSPSKCLTESLDLLSPERLQQGPTLLLSQYLWSSFHICKSICDSGCRKWTLCYYSSTRSSLRLACGWKFMVFGFNRHHTFDE